MADEVLNLTVKVNSETGQLDVVSKKLNKVDKSAKKAKAGFSNLASGAKALLTSMGLLVGAAGITRFFSSAIKEAEVFNESLRKVEFNLKALGATTRDSRKELIAWSAAIQESTRFGDNIALDTLNKMLRVTGDLAQSQSGATLAMDLAVSSGKDLAFITEIVSQLMIGETRAVIQAQKEFGAFIGTAGDTQSILDSLQESLSGAAKEEESLTKETAILSNQFTDLKKSIGFALEPVSNFALTTSSAILDVLQKIIDKIILTSGIIKNFVIADIGAVTSLLKFDLTEAKNYFSQFTNDTKAMLDDYNAKYKTSSNERVEETEKTERLISKINLIEQNKRLSALKKIEDDRQKIIKENLDNLIAFKEEKETAEADAIIARDQEKKDILVAQEQNFKSTLGTISSLASAKNRELAVVGKIAATAMAIMNTSEAVTKALASAPPPFNFALAAAVGAAGAVQIATIQGVQFAKGGLVKGSGPGIIANIGEKGRDEAILPLEDSGAMRRIGSAIAKQSGGGGGITNIYVNLSAQTLSLDKNIVVLNALAEAIAQKTSGARKLSRDLFKLQNENSGVAT